MSQGRCRQAVTAVGTLRELEVRMFALPLQAEPAKDGADKRVIIVGSITGNTNTLAGNVPPKVGTAGSSLRLLRCAEDTSLLQRRQIVPRFGTLPATRTVAWPSQSDLILRGRDTMLAASL